MTRLELALTVRDCEAEDLPALEWTGSPAHLDAILEALQLHWAGEVELVVVELPNGRLVGNGGVDYRKSADGDPAAFGELWMLSVHEDWQSLGVGSAMIADLERRIARRGRPRARIGVEHDNPRAAALYRRLGYRECGTELGHWTEAPGREYVTVVELLDKPV